jgi:hypothetical protein
LKARRLTRARVLTDLFCEFLLMLFLPRAALGRGLSKISHRLIRPPPGLRSPPGGGPTLAGSKVHCEALWKAHEQGFCANVASTYRGLTSVKVVGMRSCNMLHLWEKQPSP